MTHMVLHIIHCNGTGLTSLIKEREDVDDALVNALSKLRDMRPNGRDYYTEPGTFAQAQAQQERREDTLRLLLAEITEEIHALSAQKR